MTCVISTTRTYIFSRVTRVSGYWMTVTNGTRERERERERENNEN